MSDWIRINDHKPEEDRDLFYFFPFLGIYRGMYERTEYPEEFTGDTEEPVYGDCFYGERGFLTDDVTHWLYADGYEEDVFPDVPEGYILLKDGKFNEWSLKEDTVRIKKDEYETLKCQVKYYDEGHKMGLVCPDCPQLHIYHNDDDDGYKCNGCGKVYNTLEVEIRTYKYISRLDRPCPYCNPHGEGTKEYYQNGFLEYSAGNEPYSTEHYICNKCDSTYNIGEI